MNAKDFLLHGFMGMYVKCVEPIKFPGGSGVELYAVSPGDGGRIAGIVDLGPEIEILVSMDSEPDSFESFGYSLFSRHFSVDANRRRFNKIL